MNNNATNKIKANSTSFTPLMNGINDYSKTGGYTYINDLNKSKKSAGSYSNLIL